MRVNPRPIRVRNMFGLRAIDFCIELFDRLNLLQSMLVVTWYG